MARKQAALDIWIDWIATLVDLDEGDHFKTSSPAAGSRYLFTEADRKPQRGHFQVHARKLSLSGYFSIVNGKKKGKLFVCRDAHHYIFYPHSERRKMADIFKLNAIKLQLFSVSIGHGYMQHLRAEYLGHTSLIYHVYLFPNASTLQVSIIFPCNSSIGIAALGEGNCLHEGTEDGRQDEGTVDVDGVQKYSSITVPLKET